MFVWNRFPFVRLSFAAIGGILLFESGPKWWSEPFLLTGMLLGFFLILWAFRIPLRINRLAVLPGLAGLMLVGYMFGWIAKEEIELDDENHWRNAPGRISMFEGTIFSDPLEKITTRRYSVKVNLIKTDSGVFQVIGDLHLYIKKDQLSGRLAELEALEYGDRIRVNARPSEIPPPTNPEEFNYSAYVARQGIHGQCFINRSQFMHIGNDPPNEILASALKIRGYLRYKITDYIQNEQAQSIALALLIGVKDYLSEDLKTAYASAGAMHVLAVSGLHVGILYLLLLGILKPLKKKKGGRFFIAVISIAVIWMYTFITGMSPSVLRAAVMFSVMATSQAINRDNNIYNSLGIACFILLLYDPNFIFSVGFQLSFLALTGIVYLQPKIYHLTYISNPFVDKVWQITAVSIAAQISTLPLTVYYFHQFPTYFFLSNLVVIPGATVIMIMGISMLVVGSVFDYVGLFIGFVLDGIIQLMNYLVILVESIPGSLITWLYFNDLQVWLVYGFLILILLGAYHKSSLYLNSSILTLLLIFGNSTYEYWKQLQKEEIIIYDIASTTAVDYIKGNQAVLFVESLDEADHELLNFQINPFRRATGLKPYDQDLREFEEVQSAKGRMRIGTVSGHRILILDSLLSGLEVSKPLETDILVINNQSVRSVDWLMENFTFQEIIIGSQNSTYYSERLRSDLFKRKIRAHSLLLDGSWRKELGNS